MNRPTLFACAAALLLSSCTVSPDKAADVTAKVKTACYLIDIASKGFDDWVRAKPGKIDANGLRWKEGVMLAAKPICADPAAVTDPSKTLALLGTYADALIDFVLQQS